MINIPTIISYSYNCDGSTCKCSRLMLGLVATAVTAATFAALAVFTQGAESFAS